MRTRCAIACNNAVQLDTPKAASSKLTLLLKKSLPAIISLGRLKAYCVLFPVSLLRQQPRFVLALILILFKMPSNYVLTLVLLQCETNLVAAKRKAISLRSGLHDCLRSRRTVIIRVKGTIMFKYAINDTRQFMCASQNNLLFSQIKAPVL